MNHEIYYATGNPGKFDEVKRFIEEHEPSITLKQFDIDIPEIQSLDQKKIALYKAREAWKRLKKPLLVDDSGFYFDAYKNFPGTLTKFVYEGLGFEGIFALAKKNNKGSLILHLIYMDKPDSCHSFVGKCAGQIVEPKEWKVLPTLPWDTVFLPDGTDKTYLEMRNTPQEAEYAYRIRALKKFLTWYKKTHF